MQTPLTDLNITAAPQLDRILKTLEEERAKLKKRFTALYSSASVLAVAGILVAVAANAFLPNGSVVLSAVSAGILLFSGVLALIAIGSQTKYIKKNRPLTDWTEIKKGLMNAGFRYGNHRAFFGKFLVFREQNGDSAAIVNREKPFEPFIAKNTAAITLSLDGELSFAARVNEKNPDIRKFFVHPDYRFRVKNKPVYEKASLRVSNDANDSVEIAFRFGNANRRQFLSLVSYLC